MTYAGVGRQTLELLEGKTLFDPIDHIHDQYVLPMALAQYIGYLGPPPLEMIKQSPFFSTYFDQEGGFFYCHVVVYPHVDCLSFVSATRGRCN